LTYPTGHRRFAKNSNPTLKAQIWLQMEFCKSLGCLPLPLPEKLMGFGK
jgi:hypothetical protein